MVVHTCLNMCMFFSICLLVCVNECVFLECCTTLCSYPVTGWLFFFFSCWHLSRLWLQLMVVIKFPQVHCQALYYSCPLYRPPGFVSGVLPVKLRLNQIRFRVQMIRPHQIFNYLEKERADKKGSPSLSLYLALSIVWPTSLSLLSGLWVYSVDHCWFSYT